jgi:hypothetical protein
MRRRDEGPHMVARRLTVAVIALASAAGIGGCGDEYVRGAGVYSSTSTVPAATATSTAPSAPLQTTDSGGTESSETGQVTATQRRAVREASSAARRFLAGYLPYSYGRRNARTIGSASPALRDTLARQAPRVPPALAEKARPRLVGRLRVSGIDGRRVILLARINDGQSTYVALLTLHRQGNRWAVTQVR